MIQHRNYGGGAIRLNANELRRASSDGWVVISRPTQGGQMVAAVNVATGLPWGGKVAVVSSGGEASIAAQAAARDLAKMGMGGGMAEAARHRPGRKASSGPRDNPTMAQVRDGASRAAAATARGARRAYDYAAPKVRAGAVATGKAVGRAAVATGRAIKKGAKKVAPHAARGLRSMSTKLDEFSTRENPAYTRPVVHGSRSLGVRLLQWSNRNGDATEHVARDFSDGQPADLDDVTRVLIALKRKHGQRFGGLPVAGHATLATLIDDLEAARKRSDPRDNPGKPIDHKFAGQLFSADRQLGRAYVMKNIQKSTARQLLLEKLRKARR